MVDPSDLIWIQDAMREYGKSRPTLDALIKDGTLSTAQMDPVDRRVFLLRSELDRLFQPRITRRGRLSDESPASEDVG